MKKIAILYLVSLFSVPFVAFGQVTTQPNKYYFFCYAKVVPTTWETNRLPLIYTRIDSVLGYRSDVGILVGKFHSYSKQEWCPDKKKPCPSYTVGDTSLSKILDQQKELIANGQRGNYEATLIDFNFK